MAAANDKQAGDRLELLVIGGGITGLAAAHHLIEHGAPPSALRLVESSATLGGLIRTDRRDGLLLEAGPDSIVTHKPEGIELCRRLGLEPQLIGPEPSRSGTQVLHEGKLTDLPDGFRLLAPTRLGPLLRSGLFTTRAKLRLLAERFVASADHDTEDESISEFVIRRFGRELYERVAEPILGGLLTADTDRISVELTLPRLRQLERRHGSVGRGLAGGPTGTRNAGAGFATLREGLGSLVERLVSRLPATIVQCGARVERLERESSTGLWRAVIGGGGELRARGVILACPAYEAARLAADFSPDLAAELVRLDYASSAIVQLAYRDSQIRRPPGGHGFFVPRTAGLPILACSQVSRKFVGRAGQGEQLFRTFVGGALQPTVLDRSDKGLIRDSHRTLAALLEIEGEPRFSTVYRQPRSMPQYVVGHGRSIKRVLELCRYQPALAIAGSATGAVGLPDCIRSGEHAASALRRRLAGRGRLEVAI